MAALGLIDRYARSMIGNAESKGYDHETICRALNLAPDIVFDVNTRFGPAELCRISRNIKLMMADEFCGFTSSPCRIGTFSMMCETAVRSGTLGEALQRAFHLYASRSDEIGFALAEDGSLASVRMRLAHPEADRYNFLYEWWFMVWSRFSGWLIGEDVPIILADFPHPQTGTLEEYAEALSGACRFSQPEASFTFSADRLDRPVVRKLDDLAQFLSPKRIDLQTVGDAHGSFSALLKARMRDHLARTQELLSIEQAAHDFGVSSQTLRRRLDRECNSYRLLKEEVRREVALEWLGRDDARVGDISIKAGFAEANGLSRALKTWVGVSPTEFRLGAGLRG